MNNLKVRNVYLQIYKKKLGSLKHRRIHFSQIDKKTKTKKFLLAQNIPQGNRITLENDMKAVKIH